MDKVSYKEQQVKYPYRNDIRNKGVLDFSTFCFPTPTNVWHQIYELHKYLNE